MAFNPAFAHDVLLPLNTTAYQLSWGQELKFPPGWQQTGTVTIDQSIIDRETASGLAKIIISEDSDWGVVARKDDTSVIAIRGTETQHQWLEDFEAIAQPVSLRSWWIHHGFNDVWISIAASLQKAWDTASSAKAQVYITGHSLGAALATISVTRFQGVNCALYTFGSPRVGDDRFVRAVLQKTPKVFRFINCQDIVTQIPPEVALKN